MRQEPTTPAQANVTSSSRSTRNRRKVVGVLAGISLLGGLAVGCGAASAASGGGGGKLLSSSHQTSTTSTTALASCGSNRDPFDPTASPPPAGSPAIC